MAFLQEDNDAFEAALAFVEEFAASAGVDGGLLSPCVSAPSLEEQANGRNDAQGKRSKRPGRRAAAKKRETDEEKKRQRAELNEKRKLLRRAGVYGDANKARNERSREMAFLHEQMAKLQVDLQLLQNRRRGGNNAGSSTTLTTSSAGSQLVSLWQGLAEQQRRRCEEAERDNLLLRLAVERQRKVANGLVRMMKKRSTQLTSECSSLVAMACAKYEPIHVLDFRGDIGAFQGLFQRLEEGYRRLDDVFMANGLAGRTIPPVDVHMQECGDGKSLVFASYKVLPFDVRSTAEVTWQHFKGTEKHTANGSLYEKAEKGLDEPYTIIADFKKEVYSSSSRADIKVKQVIRRYKEQDRDVVVWVLRAEPITIKHKVLRGLTYHQHGYAVTERSSGSTPDREASVLQLCYMVTFDHDVDLRCDSNNLHAHTKFLVATIPENIRAHQERIENTLVDRSLSCRRIKQ